MRKEVDNCQHGAMIDIPKACGYRIIALVELRVSTLLPPKPGAPACPAEETRQRKDAPAPNSLGVAHVAPQFLAR